MKSLVPSLAKQTLREISKKGSTSPTLLKLLVIVVETSGAKYEIDLNDKLMVALDKLIKGSTSDLEMYAMAKFVKLCKGPKQVDLLKTITSMVK